MPPPSQRSLSFWLAVEHASNSCSREAGSSTRQIASLGKGVSDIVERAPLAVDRITVKFPRQRDHLGAALDLGVVLRPPTFLPLSRRLRSRAGVLFQLQQDRLQVVSYNGQQDKPEVPAEYAKKNGIIVAVFFPCFEITKAKPVQDPKCSDADQSR
ncbi:hypothetical protein [Rhizobium gallicum]|uniref:hypothetical protein n=1 Tax=Rhizobium gallicum TaxID=56730 RepID=UPI001EF95D13|nr:hypothetical protein [Rhizobium gallicum]ULJ70633.1 hypothetical protein L2W42_11745 [Rhizobium gallicum]